MLLLFKEFGFPLTGNVGSCVFVVLPPEEGVKDSFCSNPSLLCSVRLGDDFWTVLRNTILVIKEEWYKGVVKVSLNTCNNPCCHFQQCSHCHRPAPAGLNPETVSWR